MKKILLVLLLCSYSSLFLHAQTDTVYIQSSTLSEPMAPAADLVEARNEVLKLKEPVRTLFKINILSLTPVVTGRNPFITASGVANFPWPVDLQVAVERKVGNSVSLGLHAFTSLVTNGWSQPGISVQDRTWFLNSGVQGEARWYFQMKKQIKSGTQAANLAGTYFGFNYRWTHFRKQQLENGVNNSYGGYFMVGIQHRLFEHGYFDLGYGFGLNQTDKDLHKSRNLVYSSILRAQIGFALANPKPKSEATGNYCEALRCFREEHRLFKLDLLNLIDFRSQSRNNYLNLSPRLAWEQKIGQTPFSVETALETDLGFYLYKAKSNTKSNKNWANSFEVELNVQPRYYFNQKRSIAKGTSGNNLNGLYLGWHNAASKYFAHNETFGAFKFTNEAETFFTGPVLGCQYRFLRRGFADLYVGTGSSYIHSVQKLDGVQIGGINKWDLAFLGRFRVGVAF